MAERRTPTKAEIQSYMREHRNWGRWGDKSYAGTVNLITPEKRLSAISLVKSGRTVSLSRPMPVDPSPENERPVDHYTVRVDRPDGGGSAMDYVGSYYHGYSVTHIDALCHSWDQDGMWDGRDPKEEVTFSGARYGSVDDWSEGLITRGVLLDVPKHRGKPYVTPEEPVQGWELDEIAKEEGITLEPGDAALVYSGREAYARDHDGVWGGREERPGLHGSCLIFLRENDISILGWDMGDANPNEYDIPFIVHNAIFAFGVVILDHPLLEPVARVCAEEGRYEFLLVISPLIVVGGTGSPVNPLAVF